MEWLLVLVVVNATAGEIVESDAVGTLETYEQCMTTGEHYQNVITAKADFTAIVFFGCAPITTDEAARLQEGWEE